MSRIQWARNYSVVKDTREREESAFRTEVKLLAENDRFHRGGRHR